MNTLIGLLIIAIGSFGQSSSYVPINKVKKLVLGKFLACTRHFRMASFSTAGSIAGNSSRKYSY